MNIREALTTEHSKRQTTAIVNYISSDKKRFAQLMKIFAEGDYRLTQRAAWTLGFIAIAHPQVVKPYLPKLVDLLDKPLHVAIKRNVIRLLQYVEIPEDLLGIVADKCFTYLRSLDETLAVKAFSMTVLLNICKREPELANELKLMLEDMIPYGAPAIKSRGKKVLKELTKIKL